MVQPIQDVEKVGLQGDANVWEQISVPDATPIVSPTIFVGHPRHERGNFTVLIQTTNSLNGTIKIEVGIIQADGTIVFSTFIEADAVTADVLYTHNVTRKIEYVRLTFTATGGTPATNALSGYVRG